MAMSSWQSHYITSTAHLINVDQCQVMADLLTKPTNWDNSLLVGCYHLHLPLSSVIAQPRRLILIYYLQGVEAAIHQQIMMVMNVLINRFTDRLNMKQLQSEQM